MESLTANKREAAEEMKRFDFGEYKGQPLREVPVDYLVFIATRKQVRAGQKNIAVAELTERGEQHRLPSAVKRIKP